MLKRYKETLAAFVDGARQYCTRRGMVYLLAQNEVPVEDLIGGYLRRACDDERILPCRGELTTDCN